MTSDTDQIKNLETEVRRLSARVDWSLIYLMQALNLLKNIGDATKAGQSLVVYDGKELPIYRHIYDLFDAVAKRFEEV